VHIQHTGGYNTAIGTGSLSFNVAGSSATAVGHQAMLYANNTTSSFDNRNVALGFEALRGSTTPSANTGNLNTALGYQSLLSNSTGASNPMVCSPSNTVGSHNTADGAHALRFNTTGSDNTATGDSSLYSNTTGSSNTATGRRALFTNTTGDNNTAVGYLADVTMNSLTNATAIGYNAKVGASNSLVLGGTGADAVKVGIGTQTPSTTLEVIGQVKITGGSPGVDKVLTSDANGLATWQTPAPPAATEIAYIYNLTATTIAIEDDIPFDSNGSCPGLHTGGSMML
jgi:hypothetical protein